MQTSADWADAGVLFLNRVLTTPPRCAGGHRRKGWERITDAIVAAIAQREAPLVVMLWGNDAIKLAKKFPQRDNCLVLTSGHPSPLAYNRASLNSFKACGHFKRANETSNPLGLPDNTVDFLNYVAMSTVDH